MTQTTEAQPITWGLRSSPAQSLRFGFCENERLN
jgi:hypothetical protein